jgi:hypothetical protein
MYSLTKCLFCASDPPSLHCILFWIESVGFYPILR